MDSEMVAAGLVVLSVLSIAGFLIVIAKLRSLPANESFAQLTERLDSVARSLDEKLTQTRTDLAGRLLSEAGVACLAGTAFGPWGEGFLRLSYANSVANIEAALDAMKFLLA